MVVLALLQAVAPQQVLADLIKVYGYLFLIFIVCVFLFFGVHCY